MGVPESVLHTLRDCPIAAQVWIPLVNSNCLNDFYEVDPKDWIMLNLSGDMGMSSKEVSPSVFMTTCHYIWIWKNKELFFFYQFRRPVLPHRYVMSHSVRFKLIWMLSLRPMTKTRPQF